ncbi:MAG: BREX-4 system phosphatase PglZ [Candidatus Marinimicrobia bacterium]|nr:BREX-4 system phosphatase PglZ [Candidatus Neomarinimicrobiota bacterium]
MGVKKLYSLEELYNIIKQDKYSERIADKRFSVRFIFINSFEELREIIRFLIKNCNVESREITELLSDKNQWLTTDEIVNWVKGISNNAVVAPLSEFLRFQDKENFYITLKSLTEIEKQNNIRIYIPLPGLWERFEQEFWSSFYRKEEWAPVWKLETFSRKIIIYQINFNLDYKNISLENLAVITTTEEWLSAWKRENMKGILSLSRPLSYFYKNFLPDQAFELREISNQKEFLEEIFEIMGLMEFKDDEVEFWNELIKEVGGYNEKGLIIESIFLKHFNFRSIEKLAPKDFLELYLRTNEYYERWLIRNLFLALDKFKSSYLCNCFEKLQGLKEENLIEKVWLEIFHLPPEALTKDVFSERKEFLYLIHKGLNLSSQFIEEKLANELESIGNYPLKKKFEYLTSITFTERKYIISELKDIDVQKILSDLRRIYPELAYYLDWDLIKPDNEVDNWILEYFKEYNYSKVKHAKSPKVEELISNKNKSKSTFSGWYYSLPKAETRENLKYVWIDGLGAEWFPLIVHLLNRYGGKNGRFIRRKMLARVSLPSTTECNRYEFEKIEDLDNYVHNQKSYKYPNDLIKEIELIEKIVKKIVEMPNDKICIVSDHGFSFLCLKDFGNFKRLNLPNAEHEGRCMWIDGVNYKDDEYFIVWNVDEGNCRGRKTLVALKHISLSNTPYREVHGGATPEEVLVPYIVIEMETEKDKIEYKIELFNSEVWVTNPVIQFKIYPQPLYLPEAFLNERSLNVSHEKENDIYKIDLKGLTVGDHAIMLKIGDKHYQLKVAIKGGFKERDLL